MQTIKNWESICEVISLQQTLTVSEYLSVNDIADGLLVKHDVESNPDRALKIAQIEHEKGVKATYYFQASILYSHLEIINQVSALGHEVAYHYDVLDQMDGNYDLAIKEFSKVINDFMEAGHNIRTVCPHGNPIKIRNGWSSNKDFFRQQRVRRAFPEITDIVVQSKEIFPSSMEYITDAGYSWFLVGAIDNNDRQRVPDIEISDVKCYLNKSSTLTVLSTHPHRWRNLTLQFLVQKGMFIMLRTVAKFLAKNIILRRVLSKFYWLAKKA